MSAIRRNLAFGALSTGVSLLGGVVLVPLYLHAWGTDAYGQWIVLSAVPSAITLAEMGMNGAFANEFVIARESGQGDRANRLASSVFKAQLCVFSLCLALTVMAPIFLPIARWLAVDAIPIMSLACCIVLLGIGTVCGILAGFFSAFFRAAGRNPAFVAQGAVFKLVELASVAILLACGSGFVGVSAAIAVSRLVQLGWMALRSRSLVPDLRLWGVPFSMPDVVSVVPSSLAFFGYSFGNALLNQGAVFGMQSLLGPASVAQMSVARQFGRVFLQAISLVFAALHPEMNLAFARGDLDRLRQLQAQALFPIIWLSPLVLGVAALFGPVGIAFWTGGAVAVDWFQSFVFSAEALSYGLAVIALLPAWSANRHAAASVQYLLIQALALAVGVLGSHLIGIGALGMAFTAANTCQGIIAMKTAARVIGLPARVLWCDGLTADPWGLLRRDKPRTHEVVAGSGYACPDGRPSER